MYKKISMISLKVFLFSIPSDMYMHTKLSLIIPWEESIAKSYLLFRAQRDFAEILVSDF